MTERTIIRIPIASVKPGWVLGDDVLSDKGTILLTRDTVLTENSIAKLYAWSIAFVDIVVIEDECEEMLEDSGQSYSREDFAFFDMYEKSVRIIGEIFEQIRVTKKIPLSEVQAIAEGILHQALGVQGVLNRLRMVKAGDEYTYNHSMNVGIYSVSIGAWLNYDDKALRHLALAGLLHDVGKTKIPKDILKKPGALASNEFEIIKRHSIYGYEMTSATVGLPKYIAESVLQHHEREDGSGYPLKLSSGNIHPFAKIVAVADVYDAITSDRVYKNKRTPYSAADIIMEEGLRKLDSAIVQKFLERITTYFFTDQVLLSNGLTGTVVNINPLRPTKPLVQTEHGFIDLERTPTVKIIEVIH